MPYSPNNPPDKLKKLSGKKQRQWVHVYNSCMSEHSDEGLCHKMAWGVVKKAAVDDLIVRELQAVREVLESSDA